MTHESIDKCVHYNKKMKYSIWSMLLQFIHKLLALQSTLSIAAPRNKKYYYITPTHIGSVVAHITHNHIPPYIFCTSRISLFIFFLISIGIFFNMPSLHKTNAHQMVIYEIFNSKFSLSKFYICCSRPAAWLFLRLL